MEKYCCEPVELLIANPDCPLKYRAWTRQHILTIPQDYLKENEVCISFKISYCPRCGTKLPENLTDAWWDIIEEKFGISELFDERLKDLPEEFKTDAWWKNRGL